MKILSFIGGVFYLIFSVILLGESKYLLSAINTITTISFFGIFIENGQKEYLKDKLEQLIKEYNANSNTTI